jgi:hypothetical protein
MAPATKKSLPFCAICIDEITRDPPLQDAIGKAGALVNVCDDCATERARSYDATRGYEAPGSVVVSEKRLARLRETVAASPLSGGRTMARAVTPGWIIIRVRKRARYGKRDQRSARQAIPKEWRASARYLGCVRDHFLFERPDVAALARARTPEINLLGELADLARAR